MKLSLHQDKKLSADKVPKHHVETLQKDKEQVLRYLSEEDANWAVWTTDVTELGHEITIKSTQFSNGLGSESIGIVPIPHEKMVSYCACPEISAKWGGGVPKEIIEFHTDEATGHTYEMFLFETPAVLGGLVGARDFPEIRNWHTDEAKKASYLIYRSVEDARMPERDGCVRGVMYPAGIVLEALDDLLGHCRLTSVVHVNLGGSLWQYVCNQAIVAEMVVFYKKIVTLHKNNELH